MWLAQPAKNNSNIKEAAGIKLARKQQHNVLKLISDCISIG